MSKATAITTADIRRETEHHHFTIVRCGVMEDQPLVYAVIRDENGKESFVIEHLFGEHTPLHTLISDTSKLVSAKCDAIVRNGNRDLLGAPDRVQVDFKSRRGELHMPAGNNCDMRACVQLFLTICPDIERIQTYSGKAKDTCYIVDEHGEWQAFRKK